MVSQFLLLSLSAVLAFASSFVAKRWAASKGRFDDEARYRKLEESRAPKLPQRPSFRFTWLPLAVCVSARLYLLNWSQPRQQCLRHGIELFLPCLFAIYEVLARIRSGVPRQDDDEEEYHIENDIFQDLAVTFQRSSLSNLVGALGLSAGAYIVSLPASNSTVICPSSESRSLISALQWLGLALDSAILPLLWRILQWARTPTERFMTIGTILSASALFTGVAVVMHHRAAGEFQFVETRNIDPLYIFAVLGQSVALLIIGSILFTLHASPLASTTVITFLCGSYEAWNSLSLVGTYEQLSKAQVVLGSLIMGTGFVIVAIRNGIQHVGFSRNFIIFIMTAFVIGSMAYCVVVSSVLDRHPIDMIMYSTRTEVNRWLVQHAKVSESLRVAAREYQDRHKGRKPPPKFDIWYDYATTRNSPIIDHFEQIEEDLRPFWAMKPTQIQEEITKLGAKHGMAIVSIKKGVIAPQSSPEPLDDAVVSDLVELIQPFAQHLPDMDLPINMLDRPRVLPSWSAGAQKLREELQDEGFMWLWDHQHQLGQACPGHSASRMGFYPQNGHFCSSCANTQLTEQFLTDRTMGWDLCHQPDLMNLHGYFANHQPIRPFSDLVPVFSRTKTQQHKDILIPLSRGSDEYSSEATGKMDKPLLDKESKLFWRGGVAAEKAVPPGLLSGGHQERLSYLANNASSDDYVTVLLAKSGDRERFYYQKTPLPELNRALKLDVGIDDYSACTVAGCDELKEEFGTKAGKKDDKAQEESRYVMVMDRDDGPPPGDVLKLMRSNTVPFVMSIFKVCVSSASTHHLGLRDRC